MDYEAARRNMIESQIRTNKVTHRGLLDVLASVPRERFVPPDRAFAAYVDEDVLVAPGRYLMEPMVFARLVQLGEPKPTDRVLVVGSGTGYGAAVLARLVNAVVALESDPALVTRGREQIYRQAVEGNVLQVEGPLLQGWPEKAPYDVILLEGSVEQVSGALLDQLGNGGRLVAVIAAEDGVGQAVLHTRRDDVLSHRPYFDAAVPRLPGFERPRGFVF